MKEARKEQRGRTSASRPRFKIGILVCVVVSCQLLLWYSLGSRDETSASFGDTLTSRFGHFGGFRGSERWEDNGLDHEARRAAYLTSRRARAREGRYTDTDTPELAFRRKNIREVIKFMFRNYKERAWGADELAPVSGAIKQPFGGQGTTILDSLSTLLILGLKEEFQDAREWVAKTLNFEKIESGYVSLFETSIRNLGGLLSAYDLSEDSVFLTKARHLADKMIRAFKGTKTGVPPMAFNLKDNSSSGLYLGPDVTSLADMGTYQLEMRYLSHVTGNSSYADRANAIYERIREAKPEIGGLFFTHYDVERGTFQVSPISVGGLADSFYEYLLKVYLQGGKAENWLLETWQKAVTSMQEYLLKEVDDLSPGMRFRRLKIPIVTGGYMSFDGELSSDWRMEELTCYLPGNLALGAFAMGSESVYQPIMSEKGKELLALAGKLANTCVKLFTSTPSGLSGDTYQFSEKGKLQDISNPTYYLRPETLESLFYLHELTGDSIYREMGWKIFQSIRDGCIAKYGLAEYNDVRQKRSSSSLNSPAQARLLNDGQPSYVFAEVFKYAYLLMDPYHNISLDDYTFNTEAHPLRVFSQVKSNAH